MTWRTRLKPGDSITVNGPAVIELLVVAPKGGRDAVIAVSAPRDTAIAKQPAGGDPLTDQPDVQESE